jgi:hypothetical protein
MKTWNSFWLSSFLMGILIFAAAGNAQRVRPGKVQALSASADKDGQHPGTATTTSPASLTCVRATSDLPNGPAPSCSVTAPGFSGILEKGKSANTTGAGTVTLKCIGQGWVRCDVRIDTPPAKPS